MKKLIVVLSLVLSISILFAQNVKTIKGSVVDAKNESVPGANVLIKGTTQGTVTDINGNFSLSNVPDNAILQFSFVGMKMQEIAVGNQTTLNVILADQSIGLEEVVAIGYGVARKRDLTGSGAKMG